MTEAATTGVSAADARLRLIERTRRQLQLVFD
jgi:hypothetical protein